MKMNEGKLAIVVLAAGHGTRMKSTTPKVLHPVLGEPMVGHVLRLAEALTPDRIVVVTGAGREAVEGWLHGQTWSTDLRTVEQVDPRGTGHAAQFALAELDGMNEVLILYGDVPLLRLNSLRDLLSARGDRPLSLLVAKVPDPTGYGRVLSDDEGLIERIVEHRDASDAQRQVDVVNAGMMVTDRAFLEQALARLESNNDQGELYLTDLAELAATAGTPGTISVLQDWTEMQGINNRVQCAEATAVLRQRVNTGHMLAGVGMDEPDSAWIEAGVQIEPDASIGPDCELRGATTIAQGARISRGSVLVDTKVAQDALIKPYCVITESDVGPNTQVGPFAHLRPGTTLQNKVKVGNFVETKKALLRDGAKASHLSYLGDCDIGAASNIGAGTITCNYDGTHKHKTVLGKGVFIGSDTQLVAPVNLGDGAYVGAGGTITEDVPAGALALSRARQRNIEGWVARKQAKLAAAKEGK